MHLVEGVRKIAEFHLNHSLWNWLHNANSTILMYNSYKQVDEQSMNHIFLKYVNRSSRPRCYACKVIHDVLG